MQMATNLSPGNAQPFVEGRRVHHTNFETGEHGERHDNPHMDGSKLEKLVSTTLMNHALAVMYETDQLSGSRYWTEFR